MPLQQDGSLRENQPCPTGPPSIVIEGGMLLSMVEGESPVPNARVHIRDGKIVALGKAEDGIPCPEGAEVLDAAKGIILPGLINGDTAMGNCVTSKWFQGFKVAQKSRMTNVLDVLPRIGGQHPRPSGNKLLFLRKGRQFTPDEFRHELVVALREGDTLAVLTGCSHSGVLNMVDTVQRHFPGVPVRAVIGGFHLVALPPFNRMSDSTHDVAAVGREFGPVALDRGRQVGRAGISATTSSTSGHTCWSLWRWLRGLC